MIICAHHAQAQIEPSPVYDVQLAAGIITGILVIFTSIIRNIQIDTIFVRKGQPRYQRLESFKKVFRYWFLE